MFCRILFWIFVSNVVAALPAPGVHIGSDGTVGASWGGYSASAGLGGLLGGIGPRGGLHAEAGTPGGHFAAAGLGGSVSEGAGPQGHLYSVAGQAAPAYVGTPIVQRVAPVPVSSQASAQASASSSSDSGSAGSNASGSASSNSGSDYQRNNTPAVVTGRPNSFFDDIFNIPISTLQAVNKYLNNRQKASASRNGTNETSSPSGEGNGNFNRHPSGQTDNNPDRVNEEKTVFDDIFNIPISVLNGVNQLLNG